MSSSSAEGGDTAADNSKTARMNPENRLILIIIGSVIGGVLVLGGLLSLYRRLRDRRRARDPEHYHTQTFPSNDPTRARTTRSNPLVPGLAFHRLHTNMTSRSSLSLSTSRSRNRTSTPDLIAPTTMTANAVGTCTPRILISPPAAAAETADEYKDHSIPAISVVEPSAIGAEETDRQLAQMRARYGAYLASQGQRVRAGSVSDHFGGGDDGGVGGAGADTTSGPRRQAGRTIERQKDGRAEEVSAGIEAQAGWGGVSVPVNVQSLSPKEQAQMSARGRGLSLGKLPGFELQETIDTRR